MTLSHYSLAVCFILSAVFGYRAGRSAKNNDGLRTVWILLLVLGNLLNVAVQLVADK